MKVEDGEAMKKIIPPNRAIFCGDLKGSAVFMISPLCKLVSIFSFNIH